MRVALAFLVLALAGATVSYYPDEFHYVIENGTPFTVRIVSDGRDFVPPFNLKPAESRRVGQRKRYLPDHLQAYDQEGNLRFDKVITGEELEANGFRVVIVLLAESPEG